MILRRRLMEKGDMDIIPGAVSGSNAQALDVVFSRNDGSGLVIIRGQENWPTSGYTPIGIVVVPGTHDRYGDGTCGIMSLVGMDFNNPDTGIPVTSSGQYDDVAISWGPYSDISGIRNRTKLDGTNDGGYIPYQTSSLTLSFRDTPNIQFPYTTLNGTVVKRYTSGALSEFNGRGDTSAILAVDNATSTAWQTSSTIANNYNSGNHASVQCCWRFHTVGTSQGDWYLPAMGEVAYLPSINYSTRSLVDALNKKYGNVTMRLRGYYKSSSEKDSSYFWLIGLDGQSYVTDKYLSHCVRAFTRL